MITTTRSTSDCGCVYITWVDDHPFGDGDTTIDYCDFHYLEDQAWGAYLLNRRVDSPRTFDKVYWLQVAERTNEAVISGHDYAWSQAIPASYG